MGLGLLQERKESVSQEVEKIGGGNEEKAQKENALEPLVRLVRYHGSLPNALNGLLPRYILC